MNYFVTNKLILCAFLTLGACCSEMLNENISHIFGLFFALGLTYVLLISNNNKQLSNNFSMFTFTNMMIYAGIGLHLQSTLICSNSIMFFVLLLAGFMPTCQNKNLQHIFPVVLTSGLVILLGLFLKIFNTKNKIIELFIPGMLLFGTLMFLSSIVLHIIISKEYFYKLRPN